MARRKGAQASKGCRWRRCFRVQVRRLVRVNGVHIATLAGKMNIVNIVNIVDIAMLAPIAKIGGS